MARAPWPAPAPAPAERERLATPTGRKTKKWIKLKPDYVDALGTTMDVIIMGGYYGEGQRRSGDVSHFLMGVAENTLDGSEPKQFYTFCKAL